MRMTLGWAVSAALICAVPALANDFVDTFDDGMNHGGWAYNGGEVIENAGGNPDGWLHNDFIDSFAPIFDCTWNVPEFTGDFRDRGVHTISFDARLFGYTTPIEMTVLLRDTNGTPANFDDDDFAYSPGALLPPADGTWVHYDYAVPSQSNDPVPAGWVGGYSGDPENFRPGVDWNDVITNVDRVEIWFWHPAYFGIFTIWDAGLDNIAILTDKAVSVENTTWGKVKSLYR